MRCRAARLVYRVECGWFVRCPDHGGRVSEPTRNFSVAKGDLRVHELGIGVDWSIVEGWLTR